MQGELDDCKILIVDDDVVVRSELARLLDVNGFRTCRARSGRDAVAKTEDAKVGVVLMDIRMPGEYDGIESARIIKEHHPEKQIIFVSAFIGNPWCRSRIEQAGLASSPLIDKPLIGTKLNRFLEAVSEAVRNFNAEISTQLNFGPLKLESASGYPLIKFNTIDLLLYEELRAHPELIKTLDWRIFEKLLADILETFGYEIELTKGTKDGGIDIIAFMKSQEWGEHKYLLQAKRWSTRVGIEPVQQLLFLHNYYHASKSCFATTNTFTRGAWQLSKQYRWQLALRDYWGLVEWVERAFQIKLRGR